MKLENNITTIRVAALLPRCIVVLSCCALVSGCSATNFNSVRRTQTQQFLNDLDNRTGTVLQRDLPLTLQDCTDIALKHNLALRAAQLQENISCLERKTAFSGFLPQVDTRIDQQWMRYQPEARIGDYWVPLTDRRTRQSMLGVYQPVLEPYTWYLYSMFKNKEDIARLATMRTAQIIRLEVTGLYFRCRAIEETEHTLQAAVNHAEALHRETVSAYEQGIASKAAAAETEALVAARRFALSENRRALKRTRGELLDSLGLHPFADVVLSPAVKLQEPAGTLEELVLHALLARHELAMHDRAQEIARDKIKMALSAFLPSLGVFASLQHNTDSFVKYQTQWVGGISGVMSLFSGFADVNAYRAARQRHAQSFISREQACFMIMLQVQQAYLSLQDAHERLAVARQVLTAAQERLQEKTAAFKEGILNLSDHLKSIERRDQARVEHTVSEFTLQVARAALLDATGSTFPAEL